MKTHFLSLPIISMCALAGCATMEQTSPATIASAGLTGSQGQRTGTAKLVADHHDGLTLIVSVEALPPGVHGIHLHTTGKCDAPAFTSANGHLNPAGHQHGSMNEAGPHLGDLPNLTVSETGTGTMSVHISGDTASLESQLFDTDGTALVIHAGPDDYKTDPSGNSGSRIACGVLTRI